MKFNLAKVSLALLSAVFILGCQDVGTGPDGLVPQFNKPFKISEKDCDALTGFIFDGKGHCHEGEEPTVRPTYFITFFDGDISSSTKETRAVRDAHILIVDDLEMDLSFFNNASRLSCPIGVIGDPTKLIGNFQISSGSSDPPHLHLSFEFEDNGLTNRFGSRLEFVPDPWPPTGGEITVNAVLAQWTVGNKGRNKDACFGEGLAGTASGINFRIQIEPVQVQ